MGGYNFMKKNLLKLLLISSLCITITIPPAPTTKNIVLAKTTIDKKKVSDRLDVKFFIHEGDILVAKVLIDDKFKNNITEATISDKSLEIDIVDGQLEIYGLQAKTRYNNLTINFKDSDNNSYSYKIKDFETPDYNFIGYSSATVTSNNGSFIANINIPENPSFPIKSIKEVKISDESITAEVNDNNITLKNLKDNYLYKDLIIEIITSDNKTFTSEINPFKVPMKNIDKVEVKVSSYKNNYSASVDLPQSINPVSAEISDKDLIVDVSGGVITILELKPDTTYSNIMLNVTDDKGMVHSFKIEDFSTKNKNYGYADLHVIKSTNEIQGILILPDDLIIKNAKFSDPSLKFVVDKTNNKLIITNLKPNTTYNNLKTIVQDNEDKLHNFVINKFFTGIVNVDIDKLSKFIENAYIKAFDRLEIDKDGFNYWFEQLSNYRLSGKHFILNILNTDEFIKIAKTSHDKITRIYGVMYNRTPDPEGLKFWLNEYEKDLKITKNEKSSVLNIVKRMLDEKEFQDIISSIGIKY